MSDTRDYQEARYILADKSAMLVELRHLEALEQHYQAQIIKIAYDLDTVGWTHMATQIRKRN